MHFLKESGHGDGRSFLCMFDRARSNGDMIITRHDI